MVDLLSSPGDVLSIALHISLLEVGRKPVQVLIVGQQGVRLSTNEVVIPYVQGNSHTDGRPQAVPASNPVPELEHVGLINAKLGYQILVGAEGNKVFGNKAWILGRQKEPCLASLRIGNGLLRGEGLGGNHKQRSLWFDLLEHLSHMSSIDVRHKVNIWPNLVWLECFSDHKGAKI